MFVIGNTAFSISNSPCWMVLEWTIRRKLTFSPSSGRKHFDSKTCYHHHRWIQKMVLSVAPWLVALFCTDSHSFTHPSTYIFWLDTIFKVILLGWIYGVIFILNSIWSTNKARWNITKEMSHIGGFLVTELNLHSQA